MAHGIGQALSDGALQLKPDTVVLTEGGAEIVGHVDKVIVDRRTQNVTHLLVRKSSLLREGKLLSIELVARVGQDRVVLRDELPDLQDLPAYDENEYTWVGEHSLAPR